MSAKFPTLTVFCHQMTSNAGRPGEGRNDVLVRTVRPQHIPEPADGEKKVDPNPDVFAGPGGEGAFNFFDVTDDFAALFRRGKTYEITIKEIG